MDTRIERLVRADRAMLYALAAAVEDWPRFLPHYRWVRVLDVASDGRRTVEMAARRDVFTGRAWSGIPLRWTAIQTLDAERPSVVFEHIAGPTRGMRVWWSFDAVPDGRVRVGIRHMFEPGWPVPPALVRLVVGEYFVNGVAARTLKVLGLAAEALS